MTERVERRWLIGNAEPEQSPMRGRAIWLYDPDHPDDFPTMDDNALVPASDLDHYRSEAERLERERDAAKKDAGWFADEAQKAEAEAQHYREALREAKRGAPLEKQAKIDAALAARSGGSE